jgi:MoaA/NifB/PqqE/SkfB family radical SAM enzyme
MGWMQEVREVLPGRPQIRFTGGEPWMSPGLVAGISADFLDSVPEGLVVVNTNGTLVPEGALERFRGDSRFVSVVSLDGPATLHDSRRILHGGGSAFAAAVRGIRLIRDMDLPVYVNTVLDEDSVRDLPSLLSIVRDELGMDSMSVSLLLVPGSTPDTADRFDLLRKAYELASGSGTLLGGHHRLLLGHRIPGLECLAGKITALLDASGGVHACQRFVGRREPDCSWTPGFDWEGYASTMECSTVCMTDEDRELGDMLYDLYRSSYPGYLSVTGLDRSLFGVIR